MSTCAYPTVFQGATLTDELGGPVVKVCAADLLFAVVFLIVSAAVVLVAAFLFV